jgi:hypothetical protein
MVPKGLYASFVPMGLYYDIKIFHTGRIIARAREHEISVWCNPNSNSITDNIQCDLTLSIDQENLPFLYDGKFERQQLNDLNKQHFCKVEKIKVAKVKHVNIIENSEGSDKFDINFRFIFKQDIEARLRIFYATFIGGMTLLGLSTFIRDFLKMALISIAILVFLLSLIVSHILAPVLYKANISKSFLYSQFSY